jgi:PBSX family phage terminase large subunit
VRGGPAGLTPKQDQSIREATARLNIWEGAVRSAKTVASLLRFVLAVYDPPPGGAIVVVGKTMDTIARNIFGPLQDPALFGPIAKHVHYTRGAPTATILGRRVDVISANDAKAEGRIRGLTAALAYVDEITILPEGFWTQLLARLSVPGAQLFGTTNPDGPAHWLRKKFLLRQPELDLATWHFAIDDNTFLDPDFVTALKAEYVGLWYRRMILGEWCMAEGAVFDMFDEARHVVDQVPPIAQLLALGVDYGTRNPFAALLLGLTTGRTPEGRPHPAGRQLVFTREYRHDPAVAHAQLTDADYSREVTKWLGPERPAWIAVDPSAASFKLQMFRDGHNNVVDANNSVIDGIRMVSSLLATDKLIIHSSCKGLLDEFPTYSWDDKAAEKGEDRPVKVADHSLDGGRYAVTTTETLWRPHLDLIAA